MKSNLLCRQHQEQIVTFVCTFKGCKKQRVCCETCSQDHKEHGVFLQTLEVLQRKYQIHNHLSMRYLEVLKNLWKQQIDDIEFKIQNPTLIPIFPEVIDYENLKNFGIQVAFNSNSYSIIDYIEFAIMHLEAVLKRIGQLIPQEIEKLEKQAKAQQLAQKAQENFEDGENQQALKYINQSLSIYDQDDDLQYRKGLILQELQAHKEAAVCFTSAIKLRKKVKLPAYYAKLALSLNEQQLYQQALEKNWWHQKHQIERKKQICIHRTFAKYYQNGHQQKYQGITYVVQDLNCTFKVGSMKLSNFMMNLLESVKTMMLLIIIKLCHYLLQKGTKNLLIVWIKQLSQSIYTQIIIQTKLIVQTNQINMMKHYKHQKLVQDQIQRMYTHGMRKVLILLLTRAGFTCIRKSK